VGHDGLAEDVLEVGGEVAGDAVHVGVAGGGVCAGGDGSLGVGHGFGGQDVEDDVVGVGMVEERVVDVGDFQSSELGGAFMGDEAEHAGVENGLGEGGGSGGCGGEDGGFGVFVVVAAEGVADGFGGSADFFGDTGADFFEGEEGVERAGHFDDAFFFFGGELAEGGGAFDALFVGGGEGCDVGLEECESAFAVGVEVADGDEAVLTPALDGFGGDGEFGGEVFEGQKSVAGGGGGGGRGGGGGGKQNQNKRNSMRSANRKHFVSRKR